jgi:hypothetical protein
MVEEKTVGASYRALTPAAMLMATGSLRSPVSRYERPAVERGVGQHPEESIQPTPRIACFTLGVMKAPIGDPAWQ